MRFNARVLEDRLLARFQEAVDAELLAHASLIGAEQEASRIPKVPGVALLLRSAGLTNPRGVGDPVQQEGIVEWSAFAVGQNLRERGARSGRRGDMGAYYALEMVMKVASGFEMKLTDDEDGFPLWVDSFNLATFDQPSGGKAIYEVALRHEWIFTQEGFEE